MLLHENQIRNHLLGVFKETFDDTNDVIRCRKDKQDNGQDTNNVIQML